MVHHTLHAILIVVGFGGFIASSLVIAAATAATHMGGVEVVQEAIAKLTAGRAQGCPASVMVLCVVYEV